MRKIVIAGGGTAGWVAAAALTKQLGPLVEITLVESEQIGTVGVGEASIPTMRSFHRIAGVDEQEFMRATQATFKLGISFEGWGNIAEKYIHSFGKVGKKTWMAEFHNIWLHAQKIGVAKDLGEYCFELQAALANRFATGPKSMLNYAYHLDASRYALYLRELTEKRGLKRVEGKINRVDLNSVTGFIERLTLESGESVQGDFFIDCTGFEALLIQGALKTGFESWREYLPTNSAIAVQTTISGDIPLYTRSIAEEAGWQWRIPLQNRMGNGIVYSDNYMTDDEAQSRLINSVEGELLTEPKLIKYVTGRRKKNWNKNCLALGLSSGFLEPLESTSIHLVMSGVTRLMKFFPFAGCSETLINHYNDESVLELERIRDFIILHYKLTQREDTQFWKDRKNQQIPISLSSRMKAFEENGLIYPADGDLFQIDSWLQVMLGQGLRPQEYHHLAELMTVKQLEDSLAGLSKGISNAIVKLPRHSDFLTHFCTSSI